MRALESGGSNVDVVIYSTGMPFNGRTVEEKSLGGSESAALYLARELARRGHRVKCFTALQGADEIIDGVAYIWHGAQSPQHPLGDRFERYATNTPHDVLLIQRHPIAFHTQYAAKVCIWQLHDLALYRAAAQVIGGAWQIDAVTCVSDWHREQVKKVWGFDDRVLFTVPNGVDPALYAGDTDSLTFQYSDGDELPGRRDDKTLVVPSKKFLLLYQSRPERGLEGALALMERAKDTGLQIHLFVCAYDNNVEHMRPYYKALEDRARALPNVSIIGALTKPQLAKLQKACHLLLYPTAFEEVSCITAMEAMHAGLPMLTSACAALPETCKDTGTILIPMTEDGKVDLDAFDTKLQTIFGLTLPGEYPEELAEMIQKQHAAAKTRTWSAVADRFLDVVDTCMQRRRSSMGAVLRTALEHSDIGFIEWIRKERPESLDDPISKSVLDEVDRLYSFKNSPEAYAAHYAKHQGAYYDEHESRVVGEDVTMSTRFIGVQNFLAEQLGRLNRPLRVLDYGCAHGHYTMPLAQRFPMCDFVGVDISERAVAAARTWAEREGLTNVTFHNGAQDFITEDDLGWFDVVIAGEVIEHVWDYNTLLNKLRDRLLPKGCIIASTPLGRWEHHGTVPFRSAREHLHHFDRDDISDICYGHEHEILQAPAGHDRSGFPLGSWVWCVWPSSMPLWSVRYGRKYASYAARETISACLIVKDGEKTLRRCVESFVDWVDEIVLCVDPSTTDRTMQIAAQLAIDFPNRPFIYGIAEKSALRDGFEAARNESIAKASGDWILWVDSDEEVRRPWMLHRLCRPSLHRAYGFAQVHYAVDPDQVLTTDYPCRLFRNRIGVQFYGMVHEHPEQELSKAIPFSIVRPEIKFLHHGYFDEETRRARYERNLPLLMKDVAKYQNDRPLNKFLWLRDIAQSIQFESERTGPRPEHLERAAQGIRLMEQIAEMPQLKMISDAMPYYSLCVATTGDGFDAEMTMQVRHHAAPDLASNLSLKGRFHSREFYARLITKFSQESTKHYEDRYL